MNGMPKEVPDCLICGSTFGKAKKSLAKHLGLLPPLGIRQCPECDFCWQSPRPTGAEMTSLYEQAYFTSPSREETEWLSQYPSPDEATRRYSDSNRWSTKAQQTYHLSMIRKHRPDQTRGNLGLLEIGSGRGGFLSVARDSGFDVCGLEPSAAAVREAVASGFDVHQGTLENLPPEISSKKWDVIFMSHVFEHIDDPRAGAKIIGDLLAPAGIAVLEVPNQFEGLLPKIRNAIRSLTGQLRTSTLYSVHHLSFFSPTTLEQLFRSQGFEVSTSTWSPKRLDSPVDALKATIETLGEKFFRQGSDIQIIATRPGSIRKTTSLRASKAGVQASPICSRTGN
jgi:SAM-dependent methyltransferase